MTLEIDLLEKARTTGGGRIQARCPACAESGGDTKGEHLAVYPDGRFGCCLYPGDKQHRRRIFALAGKKKSIPVVTVRKASSAQTARQWTLVSVAMTLPAPPTAPDLDSEKPVLSVPEMKSGINLPPVGTLGTPFLNPHEYSRKKSITYAPSIYGGTDLPVPSVPNQSPALKGTRPFIDSSGGLCIPTDSPARYHWWKGGQSVDETLNEIQSAGTFSTFTAAQVAVPNQPP